jgi:hypothetical protein
MKTTSTTKLMGLIIIVLLGGIIYLVADPGSNKIQTQDLVAPGIAPDGSTINGPTSPPPGIDTTQLLGEPAQNSQRPTQGPPPVLVPLEE